MFSICDFAQIFKDGQLTKRITTAQRQNDTEVYVLTQSLISNSCRHDLFRRASPKGVRLGYMGHLTYISDEVCKLLEKCGADFNMELKGGISSSSWSMRWSCRILTAPNRVHLRRRVARLRQRSP